MTRSKTTSVRRRNRQERGRGFPRRPALVAIIATLMVLNLASPGHPASGADGPGRMWTVAPTQRIGSDPHQWLLGVDSISKRDAWAVGGRVTGTQQIQPLIEHWDGAVWRAVDSPSPDVVGSNDYLLSDVAAATTNDVWAVGGASVAGGETTLIERWNGVRWKVVPSPNSSYDFNGLHNVKALGPEDVWAVGTSYGATAGVPLAEHWDGKSWSVVPTPGEPDRYVEESLDGLSAVSADDIWAVGLSRHRWDGPRIPLSLHWDGTEWTRVPVPNPWPDGADLEGVAAVSSTDVWAVGSHFTPEGPLESTVVHWDGNAWSVVAGPSPGTESGLSAVAADSASSVWAVGLYTANDGTFRALAQHWNGERWRVVPTPNLTNGPRLEDVESVSRGELWAVGTDSSPNQLTLAEHFGVPFCADGVDNDGDGGADYPADLGCESSTDGSEFLGTGCDDGYDGDHDGLTDYPTDPGCSGVEDRSERGTVQCDDGLDNDGDGKVDYGVDGRGDPECTSPSDDSEFA